MRKFFCFAALFAAFNSFSQKYETHFIDQPVITFNCQSFLVIKDFIKINTDESILGFQIKSGGFQISISGAIDRSSTSQITISLYATELLDDQLNIVIKKDSQQVQYKIAGAGDGLYGGRMNDDDRYIINTIFKIVAPGHPDLILLLPLNVYISRTGNNNITHCFVDGKAYLSEATRKKNKRSSHRSM